MKTPPIQIEPEHWEIVQNIFQKYVPDHSVWAFGSRARRRASRFSDLDIVVETEEKSSSLIADMRDAFSECRLPWTVDIIDRSECSADFLHKIAKDRVDIWGGGC